ncbi:MAG: hypothetical protein WA814_08550 [Candidatus Baltobacteraceae bacterium]
MLYLALSLALSGATPPPTCSVTAFPRYGTYVAAQHLHGPGLLLDGGGAEDAPNSSLAWLHRRLLGENAPRGGNLVILRAYGANVNDKNFYTYAKLASVQTVLIPPCASRAEVDAVAPIVDRADALFFSGGDQANYVAWKGSALIAAAKRVYARGGVVGGGSAGLAIQGAVVYDSVAGDRLDKVTHTKDAVADPFEPTISFTTGLFAWPALADTITDTHLVVRDRLGRMVVFLARILHDHLLPGATTVYGLGIDEASSVGVDPDGMATLFNGAGGRGAFLVRADSPPQLAAGEPLKYSVSVSHVARDGARFDLLHRRTSEPWFTLTIDGTRQPTYSPNPYHR